VHTKFVPDLAVLPEIDDTYVRAVVQRSLNRLQVEALDLVQFHWCVLFSFWICASVGRSGESVLIFWGVGIGKKTRRSRFPDLHIHI
jgi:hypothetical protein